MPQAKIDAVVLPRLTVQRTEHRYVMDEGPTADGSWRRDVVTTTAKRVWHLVLTRIKKSEYDAIKNHLNTKNQGTVDFWLAEFGAEVNTVPAFVTLGEFERIPTKFVDGTFDSFAGTLPLTVTEV